MSKVIKKVSKPVTDTKKDEIIRDLSEIMEKIGFKVRIEKGIFKGGYCLLREEKIILINKNLEQDKKISILLKNIPLSEIENIFIKPGIRELIYKETDGKMIL